MQPKKHGGYLNDYNDEECYGGDEDSEEALGRSLNEINRKVGTTTVMILSMNIRTYLKDHTCQNLTERADACAQRIKKR